MNKRGIIKLTPEMVKSAFRLKDDLMVMNMFQTDRDKESGVFSITLAGNSDCLFIVDEGWAIPHVHIEDVQK